MIGKLIKVTLGGAILTGLALWAGVFDGCGTRLSLPSLPSFSSPTSAAGSDSGAVVLHYAPSENLERVDLQQLATLLQRKNGEPRHLDVAMYGFTDQILAEALVQLSNNGYNIRVYRDGEQYQGEIARGGEVAQILQRSSRIQVRVKPPSRSVLMHLKAYSDGTFLRDGSANWSSAGLKRQDNSLLIIYRQREIEAFEHDFQKMWDRADNAVIQ